MPVLKPWPLALAIALAYGLPLALAHAESTVQQQVLNFDLAAAGLGATLNAIARQSGQVVSLDPQLVSGKQAPAVRGSMTAQQAMQLALTGSGLQLVVTESGSFSVIQASETSGALELRPSHVTGIAQENPLGQVSGYLATRATTATKTDTPLLETTQSVSVITRDRMKAQGVQTVSDGLAYTGGVRSDVSGNNPTDNTIMVRGFQQITANAYTDGLRNNQIGYYAPEPFGMERIEVLKGPSSVLYGQGSPGGTVNFVSKRPTFTTHREIGYSTGSNERQQLSVDLGDTLGDHGDLSYRLVALGRDANNSVDYIKDDRVYIAPSLTWNISDATSLTLLTSYQRNKNLFTSNLPYSLYDGSNPNGRLSRSRSLNEPGFDGEKSEQTSAGYELSHELNDSWTFRQNFRYTHFTGYSHQLYRNSGVIGGNTINRYYQLRDYENDNYALDNHMVGKFDTGLLSHHLLMGADYQRGERSSFTQTGNAPAINLYAPIRGVVIDTSQYTSLLSTAEKNRQLGLYLQDQIRLGNWVASLGGRYDWASIDTSNRRLHTLQSTDAENLTGRVGLGYLFDIGLFPYISYAESFNPTSGNDSSGSQFEPETAKQYEAGVKYQPTGSESYITLAAFDLRRQNVLTNDTANPGFSVQEGEVTSRGIELEGVLKPVEGLNVIASYTVNDVEVTKDNPNAAGISNKGKVPFRVPEHLASLWTDYTLQSGPLAGLGFGVGARYTGDTFGDAQNTFKVPSYTLVDAMIRYDFGKADASLEGLSAAVNVKNLTDKYYVAGCFIATACLVGAERTVTADVTYNW
ncbi:TonB-dependent siderophore receptor [Pseudomonas mendocina]|nr:TonB-dependent siderophore receptor [Pseudomonas mendocina]